MQCQKSKAPPGGEPDGASQISQRAAANINTTEDNRNRTDFQEQVRHLHALGPSTLTEFLSETVDPLDLEIELARYARLDPRDLCGAACLAGYPADPKRRN